MEKLDRKTIEAALENLPGWTLENGKLRRVLVFGNFIEAFAFMTEIAMVAEAMDHHPEWSNVYKTVTIELTTHSEGGITKLDIALAEKINRAEKRRTK